MSKLCWKILFSRKLVSTFISSHNSNPIVKNSESPPIRVLIHDQSPCSWSHISFKAYRIFCNYSKRRIVQGYLLGVEKRCTRKLSSWYTEELYGFDKGCFVKWCTRSWFWDNLKRVAWGLDIGQEDRISIKSLVFAFALFLSFYSVHFLSYKLFVIEILLTLLISILVFVLPSCSAF